MADEIDFSAKLTIFIPSAKPKIRKSGSRISVVNPRNLEIYDSSYKHESGTFPERYFAVRLARSPLVNLIDKKCSNDGILTPEEYKSLAETAERGGEHYLESRKFSNMLIKECLKSCACFEKRFSNAEYVKVITSPDLEYPSFLTYERFTPFAPVEELDELSPPKTRKKGGLSCKEELQAFHYLDRLRLEDRIFLADYADGKDVSLKTYEKRKKIQREIIDGLTSSNLPIAISAAKKRPIGGIEFSELVSEGYFAVFKAVEKFDVSLGWKFSTYAYKAILKSFHRHAQKIEKYKQLFPAGYDEKLDRVDSSTHHHAAQHSNNLDHLQDVLAKNRAGLDETEYQVICDRFLFEERKTLKEIGKETRLSSERVRQKQNNALDKIKRAIERTQVE